MDAILSRRSIRKYEQRDVDQELLEDLLRAAMNAPSAGNEQPWEFIVIRKREVLNRVAESYPDAQMLLDAPVALLICGNLQLEKHDGYWVQDCSAAAENILIAAEEKNLGAVWVGIYPRKERVENMQNIIGLPEHVVPLALIPIGYPAEDKPPVDRFDPAKIHYEGWQDGAAQQQPF